MRCRFGIVCVGYFPFQQQQADESNGEEDDPWARTKICKARSTRPRRFFPCPPPPAAPVPPALSGSNAAGFSDLEVGRQPARLPRQFGFGRGGSLLHGARAAALESPLGICRRREAAGGKGGRLSPHALRAASPVLGEGRTGRGGAASIIRSRGDEDSMGMMGSCRLLCASVAARVA